MSPFVALILAELILCIRRAALRRGALVALALLSAAVAVSLHAMVPKATDFSAAAAAIRAQSRPGDVVWVPQSAMFWGMAWYLAGPSWGSPLAIANPPNPQWREVYHRLGPALVDRLGWMPKGQTVTAGDITLLVGDQGLATAEPAPRVWLVTYPRADLGKGLPPPGIGFLRKATSWRFGTRLDVALYEPAD
jgi:hypothetical protein